MASALEHLGGLGRVWGAGSQESLRTLSGVSPPRSACPLPLQHPQLLDPNFSLFLSSALEILSGNSPSGLFWAGLDEVPATSSLCGGQD